MEREGQRSRDRDRDRNRTPRSRFGSSRRSASPSSSALTRQDRDGGHEGGTSVPAGDGEDQRQHASPAKQVSEPHQQSARRTARPSQSLCRSTSKGNHPCEEASKKKLEGIDIDKAWEELTQTAASSNNPEALSALKLLAPLHQAAQSGYTPMCKLLITQCKCDVNASTIDGTTPLMLNPGNKAIVEYLMNNQADPNKADNSGITPLHIAATQGYYEIADYLLSKGANVDPLCQVGESPLFCAALQGNERIVALLLKHDADCNRLSKNLLTPLLASLYGSSLSCLEILIEAGADLNETGCSIPPVALAAYLGLDCCIKCLLRNGANPNMPDEDNNTPVQIAAFKGWEKCLEILLPHAPHLTQYDGLSISQIIQLERNDRFHRCSRAIELGDAAYWRKEHDIALKFYKEAAQIGHKDPALLAKRSLCQLYLRDTKAFTEEAINYMNLVQPNLSTLDRESDAKKLVLNFARTWSESGSVSRQGSRTSLTDEALSSGEHL